MDYIIIIAVAFGASMLTFFSGFGLGTMLTPAFLIFFPPEIAVAITAIVHFLNNLFKLVLVGKHAVKSVILKFGIPAILGAFAGAAMLGWLSELDTSIMIGSIDTTLINIVLGLMIFFFSLVELLPSLKKKEFPKSWLVPGGILSGFFGGLSGHQGALRSAFLIRFHLDKKQFVSSGIVIACLVDTIRISTYAFTFNHQVITENGVLISIATLAAFGGALLGKRLLEKITVDIIQKIVGILMIIISALLFLNFI